jgi:hypothetical protein
MANGKPTLRRTATPFELVRAAIGDRRAVVGKLARLGRTVRLYVDFEEIERRMHELQARGFVRARPTRLQIAFGAMDMFRWVIVPAARDYYRQQGINFELHQLLRFLDDPVSIIDPTGLLSDRDTIIGHLMQVVHLNPIYDLQLLQMFPDGLDELERQVESMISREHPRAGTIGAIVEDADYHRRLLGYVRSYRADPSSPEIVRGSTLRGDPHYAAAECTFASLPGFVEYCAGLPSELPALVARRILVRRFPLGPS